MGRKIIITIILIISTILILNLNTEKPINQYSYTTAICDESNYCEDYYIECNKGISQITPTGFAIQNPKNWKDPRDKINNYCAK